MRVLSDALSVVSELMNAANDEDALAIERAALALGWLWNCTGDGDFTHWTNPGDAEKCEHCGRERKIP